MVIFIFYGMTCINFIGDNVFKIGRTTNIQRAQHSENKGLKK